MPVSVCHTLSNLCIDLVVREYVLYITAYASVCAGVRHSVSNLCVSLVVRGYVVSVHSCVLFVSFGCNYSLFVCLA